jgi:hypothetical protein
MSPTGPAHDGYAYCVCASGARVWSGGGDGSIVEWNTESMAGLRGGLGLRVYLYIYFKPTKKINKNKIK